MLKIKIHQIVSEKEISYLDSTQGVINNITLSDSFVSELDNNESKNFRSFRFKIKFDCIT